MMQINKKILTAKDIMQEYNLSRDMVYKLLNKKGCPLTTGKKKREKYTVLEEEFHEWLRNLYKQRKY